MNEYTVIYYSTVLLSMWTGKALPLSQQLGNESYISKCEQIKMSVCPTENDKFLMQFNLDSSRVPDLFFSVQRIKSV